MVKTQAELSAEQVREIKRQMEAPQPGDALSRLARGNGDMAAAEDSRKPAATRSLIQLLSERATRDRDDYAELISSLRRFVEAKRADLETFERLIGTK